MLISYAGQIIDFDALLAEILDRNRANLYHPWFYTYCGKLASPEQAERYVRLRQTIFRQSGINLSGKHVLDAGSGFGINALLMALMGAAAVHAVDIHRGMISTTQQYLSLLPFTVPVFPGVADVASLPYESGSFDVVISIEAISHYNEVDRFLFEAARVLRPGGVLVVVDTNNGRNFRIRRRTQRVWQLFESGPPGSLPGHTVERPFVTRRQDIARERYPQLSESELHMLAAGTSGLWGSELDAAFDAYVNDGTAPERPYVGGPPVDPRNGVYIEYLFDPVELGNAMKNVGLTPAVYTYFGGARGGVLAVANRVLSARVLTPLTLPLARGFIISGRKGQG